MAALPIRIARLQNAIVRELNDIHIFIRQALPLLEESKAVHAASTHKKDRRYYVPSTKRRKFARRKDKELKEIYDRFTSSGLYESFLITAIGEFEEFLGRVLREVFRAYPRKLGVSASGIAACHSAPLDAVLASATVEEVLERTIEEHLRGVFFPAPRKYVEYFSRVVGTDVDDPAFLDYYELKATRDLLVHSGRVISAMYIEKAGSKARGAVGQSITVDSEYFDGALATLKRLSGIIKRDAAKAFPVNPTAA